MLRALVVAVVGLLFQAAGALPRPPEQPKGDAVISGVVRDDQHAPVARALVLAFAARDARAASGNVQRLTRSSGSASTDETGTFRIFGLPAGDYVIAAEATPTFPGGGPLPLRVWGPTFYPSTLEISQAVSVSATPQVPASVQIELVPVAPVRVTGTVITASGSFAQGFDVSLFRSFGGFGGGGPVASVGPTGAFEISRVPPGLYELTVAPHATEAGEKGREFVDRMMEVRDRDVDLSLTAGPGASLTGRVIVEPAGVLTTPIGLRIAASHDRAHGAFSPDGSIYAAVNADWSFSMTGLSGWYDFSARSDRPPPAVVATRVVVDGKSFAEPTGIALAEGRHEIVVNLAPRDVAGLAINPPRTVTELVGQFKTEKLFSKQFGIGQAIVDTGDRGVLPAFADWLTHPDRHIRGNVAFIFAKLGDPRGLHIIAEILSDRSERPEGQGIPGAFGLGGYHYDFRQQVAADRYYAAHLLGDLKDPLGVDLLVPLLDDPETQSIAPWSLAQIGDRRAIPPLIAALDQDDPSMRVIVIYALEALHATEAVPRLRMFVNDDRKSRFGALVSVSEAAKAAIARLQ